MKMYSLFKELRQLLIYNILGGSMSGGATGISVYNGDKTTIRNQLIIDNCTLHDCQPAWSEALTLSGNIQNFQVTNNRVYNMNNIGMDFAGTCLNTFLVKVTFLLDRWMEFGEWFTGSDRFMC
jgi:hypothetical protein